MTRPWKSNLLLPTDLYNPAQGSRSTEAIRVCIMNEFLSPIVGVSSCRSSLLGADAARWERVFADDRQPRLQLALRAQFGRRHRQKRRRASLSPNILKMRKNSYVHLRECKE